MYLYAVKCQFAERMCSCGNNEFFLSITTRASVSIEAVLFSVFRTGVLSYLRVFKTIILHHISNISIYADIV